MEFRESGRRATIWRVDESQLPYRVQYHDAEEAEWLTGADLMLYCGCDIVRGGCTCGVFTREQEALAKPTEAPEGEPAS